MTFSNKFSMWCVFHSLFCWLNFKQQRWIDNDMQISLVSILKLHEIFSILFTYSPIWLLPLNSQFPLNRHILLATNTFHITFYTTHSISCPSGNFAQSKIQNSSFFVTNFNISPLNGTLNCNFTLSWSHYWKSHWIKITDC